MIRNLQPARPLGRTGISVPLIGYGTAPLGKPNISRADAVRCLNTTVTGWKHHDEPVLVGY